MFQRVQRFDGATAYLEARDLATHPALGIVAIGTTRVAGNDSTWFWRLVP
jgi:hypothetical protein